MVLENLHMELLQRILISIQAACFLDFSLITNNYGYGWSWKTKGCVDYLHDILAIWHLFSTCWTKELFSLNQNMYHISDA
jgi:hypothetical protein